MLNNTIQHLLSALNSVLPKWIKGTSDSIQNGDYAKSPYNTGSATTQRTVQTESLRAAIAYVGSQRLLAESLGLKQGHISVWLNRDGQVPAERVLAIEAATDGSITRYALRPDIYGSQPSPQQLFSAALRLAWEQIAPPMVQVTRVGTAALVIGVFILVPGDMLWNSLESSNSLHIGIAPHLAQTNCLDCDLMNSCTL